MQPGHWILAYTGCSRYGAEDANHTLGEGVFEVNILAIKLAPAWLMTGCQFADDWMPDPTSPSTHTNPAPNRCSIGSQHTHKQAMRLAHTTRACIRTCTVCCTSIACTVPSRL